MIITDGKLAASDKNERADRRKELRAYASRLGMGGLAFLHSVKEMEGVDRIILSLGTYAEVAVEQGARKVSPTDFREIVSGRMRANLAIERSPKPKEVGRG